MNRSPRGIAAFGYQIHLQSSFSNYKCLWPRCPLNQHHESGRSQSYSWVLRRLEHSYRERRWNGQFGPTICPIGCQVLCLLVGFPESSLLKTLVIERQVQRHLFPRTSQVCATTPMWCDCDSDVPQAGNPSLTLTIEQRRLVEDSALFKQLTIITRFQQKL